MSATDTPSTRTFLTDSGARMYVGMTDTEIDQARAAVPVLCFCRKQCYGAGYRCGGRKGGTR